MRQMFKILMVMIAVSVASMANSDVVIIDYKKLKGYMQQVRGYS